jgi:penicillin-binding protein 1A
MARKPKQRPAEIGRRQKASGQDSGSANISADQSGKKRRSFWGFIVYWLIVLGLWVGIGLGGLVGYYAMDLPDTAELWQVENRPEFRFYGDGETLLARRGRLNGRPLLYEDLPPDLVNAVISIEDRRFWDHFGLDPRGFARAMFNNIRAGAMVQGGSTLTQQLAKNVFLTPDRTIKRKVQELLLAFWLEAQLSKEEILALYMNRVYFGAGAYGVHAAAETYYDRPVQELSLGEAAILAGLLKAPSRLAPNRNPDGAKARAKLVLQAMVDNGAISQSRLAAAPLASVQIVTRSSDTAHYAIDWALEQLPEYVGRPRSDLDIVTTINPALQLAAERAAQNILKNYGGNGKASQVAMVVMTPQGQIRALVGGKSYRESQYNRAIMSKRQPGSAFKPIIYLAGLEKGMTPDTIFTDEPFTVEGWTPSNYSDEYLGDVTMRESLAKSVNTVAAQISERAGRDHVIDVARRLGVTSYLASQPSIALGVFELSLLELTSVYATLAQDGFKTFPHIIDQVVSHAGSVLYERKAGALLPVIQADHVAAIRDMLEYSVENGTGKRAQLDGIRVGGKTGTSQNWRDAWFIGYTPDLVAGVWVGNDDGTPMNRVAGSSLPAMIWHDFMEARLEFMPAPVEGESQPKAKRKGLFNWLFGD